MKPIGSANRVWREPLLHPICLLSMAVWWLNDHVGKVYAPSALTGKASAVACLVVFRLWVWCLVDGAARLGLPLVYRSHRALRLRYLYDAADLLTVPAALVGVWVGRAWLEGDRPRAADSDEAAPSDGVR